MVRYTLVALVVGTAAHAADGKEDVGKYQGAVMSAIQEARLDRVKADKLEAHLLENEPSWPESYNVAIQQFAPVVYGAKRRDLKNVDLGAQVEQQCLDNWDKIQEMTKSASN